MADWPAFVLADRALIPALLRYVRRLECGVGEAKRFYACEWCPAGHAEMRPIRPIWPDRRWRGRRAADPAALAAVADQQRPPDVGQHVLDSLSSLCAASSRRQASARPPAFSCPSCHSAGDVRDRGHSPSSTIRRTGRLLAPSDAAHKLLNELSTCWPHDRQDTTRTHRTAWPSPRRTQAGARSAAARRISARSASTNAGQSATMTSCSS